MNVNNGINIAVVLGAGLLVASCATGPHELTLDRAKSSAGSLYWTKRMDQIKENLVPPSTTPYQETSKQTQYVKGFADAWEFQESLRFVGAFQCQYDAKMKEIDEMSKKPEKQPYASGFQDGIKTYSNTSSRVIDEVVEFRKQMEKTLRQGYTW